MTIIRRLTLIRALSALLVLAGTGIAAGPALAANTIVVDVATGKVLSESNATQRWYPASTTKLMTTYVALKALQTGEVSADLPVVMSRAAAAEPPSKMAYPAGSVMRLDVALRMMLVKSANDVAFAIGQTLGKGSLEAFVDRMNAEAAALGMRDSHFVNANGLPAPGQYSSAKDLAILAVALRKEFPAFSDYFSTEAIAVGKGTMKNHNGLLGRYNGADGMKTGYICASGFNLVASATRDNRTLVAVVLGAEGPIVRERTAAEILENGFNTNPRSIRDTVADLPVSSGPPADISAAICSPAGRTARANERQEEDKREDTFGSPYMTDLQRTAVAVPVDLGGAAGAPGIEAGTRLIAAYGIPVPTWRPARPGEPGFDGELPVGGASGEEHPASPAPAAETAAAGGE
ncbi:D-alanyl-D-alanine carboxypeptidase family protein [Aureimonas sp. AU22]|uniref:D-alanyl-D-alanine carboxypeptidase family protein n=1 Tax=Aureimonas sp. AU22 TaxID=1638162 RepID=UPI000706AD54|nr:D-alanyl-D-alanine carboxypeptidase family protein [Aureimonas sp. AU22]BAT29913.1 D-alanyl-D-alanine carboxypeptidase [Aureimonas sp. AU22]